MIHVKVTLSKYSCVCDIATVYSALALPWISHTAMTGIHGILESNICPDLTIQTSNLPIGHMILHIAIGFLIACFSYNVDIILLIHCSRQVLHQFRERDLRRLHYREDLQRPEAQHHPHRARGGQLHLAASSQILH